MGTRSRANWKLDAQGQYSRQIGSKLSRNGKRGQHKFRLGSDLNEAQRRERCLADLWQQIAAMSDGQAPSWNEDTLEIGSQIARGQQPVCLPRRQSETDHA